MLQLFQSYYSLISNILQNATYITTIYFNPIIVLFLTIDCRPYVLRFHYFNPIIVLFLTNNIFKLNKFLTKFQSYYSLISNFPFVIAFIKAFTFQSYYSLISNLQNVTCHITILELFQSYYSLISNL